MISLDIGHENLSALEATGHRYIVGRGCATCCPRR